MDFINKDILKYLEDFVPEEDSLLAELRRETNIKIYHPKMLSGHFQSHYIKMFCKLLNPKKILEIGTYTGYGAISMAKNTADDTIVHTIDINDEIEDFTLKWIKKSGYENKIKYHIGDALKIIPDLNQKFDLIYIDGDKRQYLDYYKTVFPFLNEKALIIVDNVLWSGKILKSELRENDYDTRGIIKFNEFVVKDDKVDSVILPVRDGLMIIYRK